MKLLVCDMDQTLTSFPNKPTSWAELSHMLDVDNSKLYNRYINDEDYSYVEFTEDTVEAYIDNNISKSHIEELREKVRLKNGYYDLVDFADNICINKVIITGGIGNIAELLCRKHGFDSYYSSCYFKFNSNNKLSDYSVNGVGGSDAKFHKMKDHIKGTDIEMDDIIFVGDDINDKRMIKEVGHSFNIGDKDIGAEYNIDDLSEVRKILESK